MVRWGALLAAAVLLAAAAPAPLMGWDDLFARPMPKADARIAYGPAPEQVAELWRPAGPGPFPVVLMIHGGCWRSNLASLSVMNYAAADLRRRGIAVWNVEYRGVDRPGGGYPGTFQDVVAAATALQRAAHGGDLDLRRLAIVGHSAGGHLALWLAGASRIESGPLAGAPALHPRAVFSLGGVPDLATAPEACGPKSVAAVAGPPGAVTSVPALLPLRTPQVVLNGPRDETATPAMAAAYAAKARAAGDRVRLVVTTAGGHVEEIAPGSEAWDRAAAMIAQTLIR